MGNKETYYDILGVTQKATKNEIKKRFKELALKWHPDKWVNKSEDKIKIANDNFKKINEANSTLSDDKKRVDYDTYLKYGNSGGLGDISNFDEFEKQFKNFNDFNPFANNMQRKRQNVGGTIKIQQYVTIEDVFNKREIKIKYKRQVPCTSCNGSGISSSGSITKCTNCGGTGMYQKKTVRNNVFYSEINTCNECHGTGEMINGKCPNCGGSGLESIEVEKTIMLSNPIGVVLKGEGSAPLRNDGIYGDLAVYFIIKEDNSGFSINQSNPLDIIYTLKVPILDCITGDKKNFKYINNKEYSVTIPMGSKNGDIMRLGGLGLTIDKNVGDLYIIIEQIYPKTLNNTDIKEIEKLKKKKNFICQ